MRQLRSELLKRKDHGEKIWVIKYNKGRLAPKKLICHQRGFIYNNSNSKNKIICYNLT